jgi:hypothetical protein
LLELRLGVAGEGLLELYGEVGVLLRLPAGLVSQNGGVAVEQRL